MSRHWGYYCLSCAVKSDAWFEDGEEKLKEYFDTYQWLLKRDYPWISIGVFGNENADKEMENFLMEHKDHRIAIMSDDSDIKLFRRGKFDYGTADD